MSATTESASKALVFEDDPGVLAAGPLFRVGQSSLTHARTFPGVPFNRSPDRLLPAPGQAAQDTPDMTWMVVNPRSSGDHLAHPAQRPELSGKATGSHSLSRSASTWAS